MIGFQLRYYASYQGFQGSRSGAAIFRPESSWSYQYSQFLEQQLWVQESDIVSQFTLHFNDRFTKERAMVKIRMYKDDPMLEWDVELEPIPIDRWQQGKEVTVNFVALDIDNGDEFYTDSNGLEMQARKLNFRPTFNYSVSSHHNVSVNYYPVTSAIAIRDKATHE